MAAHHLCYNLWCVRVQVRFTLTVVLCVHVASLMPTLHVHLLGDFYIRYGDETVTAINDTRLQSLLAYLLLHRHARQSRQHIAFLLWPDSNESQARANLRKTLHHLRRQLPDVERFFHIDARSLQWRPDAGVTLDVAEFEGKLSQVDALDAGDQVAVRAALEEATALYRGDLLPSCYDDWILAEREELRQRFMEALERLARLLEDQRDYPGAMHSTNRLLRYDPLNETTYQRLMRLHALAGDRAGALRIYHTYTTVLQRDLGVEPGHEVQAFYARLLNRDAPAVLELQASQSREVAHLVGRHAEWRALQSAWRSAACGRAQFFLLGGVAGIGKSRLAEELRTWAREQGIATAWTRAYMAAGRLAFAPIAGWLRTDTLQATLEKLDEVWLTELAASVAGASGPETSIASSRAIGRALAAPAAVRGHGQGLYGGWPIEATCYRRSAVVRPGHTGMALLFAAVGATSALAGRGHG